MEKPKKQVKEHEDESSICLQNVSKSFDQHLILDGLNFDIHRGKISTILGFSGSGKSTLLKLILGLLTPDQGKVLVLGKDLTQLGDMQLREFRRHFGMLFQYAALFDSLSAFENVAFPLREFTRMSEEEIANKASSLLKEVDLKKESFNKLPSELSGGMRKRVGLARALALDPDIMLYDEPTTGLDPVTTKRVNDLIIATHEKGKDRRMTTVIISHDVKATLAISDYVAFLSHGKICEYLPASEFAHSQNPQVREFINL